VSTIHPAPSILLGGAGGWWLLVHFGLQFQDNISPRLNNEAQDEEEVT